MGLYSGSVSLDIRATTSFSRSIEKALKAQFREFRYYSEEQSDSAS